MKPKLNIQAIFDSIDGEENAFDGAGQLTTFIRLKGCNLSCSYCDTKYAQNAEPKNLMTIEEVIQQVHFPKVTITGGEPLLQRQGVETLCSRLVFGKLCEVSVETNGVIQPEYFLDKVRYIVDFKLPSSGMVNHMKSSLFYALREVDVIKFVISDEEDYRYAKRLLQMHLSWEAKKVFSPALGHLKWTCYDHTSKIIPGSESFEMAWPRQLAEMMIRDKIPAQFSLQLHKILWPGATGAKEER